MVSRGSLTPGTEVVSKYLKVGDFKLGITSFTVS